MHFYSSKKRNSGFTLIELLVVIAIIGILSSTVLVSLSNARAKARDAWRLSELTQIKTALELYYSKYNRYPDPSSDAGAACGGWDSTSDGTFIGQLVADGDMGNISDPSKDNVASCSNFRYYRYVNTYSGSGNSSCAGKTFYVLGVVGFETISSPSPSSPGWLCTADTVNNSSARNWQSEFSWVTGKFE